MSTVNVRRVVANVTLILIKVLEAHKMLIDTLDELPREADQYTIEYFLRRDLKEIHELFDKLIRKLHEFLGNYGRSI